VEIAGTQDSLKETVGYVRRAVVMLALYQLHSYVYNYVATHPAGDNYNLMTSFDHIIPLIPWMVYPYMSLYLGIFLATLFLKKGNFLCLISVLVFAELLTYPVFYFFRLCIPHHG